MNEDQFRNIEAEIFEKEVFFSFKRFFEDHLQEGQRNVTVLQGWKRHWTSLQFKQQPKKGDSKGDEHDLIIVDGSRKFLILFEAKMSISHQKTMDKAMEQLRTQVEYFRKYHGHVMTAEWQMVTVIPYKTGTSLAACKKCCHFLLDIERHGSVTDFWSYLDTEAEKRQPENTSDSSYKTLVGRIVGLASGHKHFVSNMAKYRNEVKKALTCDEAPISGAQPPQKTKIKTDNSKVYPDQEDDIGDERLIFFLSPEQRKNMDNRNNLWMVLEGEPGTGKSLLLKIKAWELSRQGKKVAFVVGRTKSTTSDIKLFGLIFYQLTKREFEGSGVEVFFAPDENLTFFIQKYEEGYHILWDEASFSIRKGLREFFRPKADLSNEKFFWIVQSPDIRDAGGLPDPKEQEEKRDAGGLLDPEDQEVKEFFSPAVMKICFRNSFPVQNVINFFEKFILGKNRPSAHQSEDLKLPDCDLPRVILYRKDLEAAILHALESYRNDSVLVFNEDNLDLSFVKAHGWKVLTWQDFLDAKDQEENQKKKSSGLKKTNAEKSKMPAKKDIYEDTIILGDSFEGLAGIEVKNVIFFSEHLNKMVSRNFITRDMSSRMEFAIKLILLRAISHLTIIMNDFSVESIQPLKMFYQADTAAQEELELQRLTDLMQRDIQKTLSKLKEHSNVTHM